MSKSPEEKKLMTKNKTARIKFFELKYLLGIKKTRNPDISHPLT
tara:strand:+ start:162 stop:293 length:132 start_codon:yes stop_codon:yes gene_type:complete